MSQRIAVFGAGLALFGAACSDAAPGALLGGAGAGEGSITAAATDSAGSASAGGNGSNGLAGVSGALSVTVGGSTAGSGSGGASGSAVAAGTGGGAGALETPNHPPPGERLWADGEWLFTGARFAVTNAPDDWQAPVDYYDGSIQVRVVVRDNPQHQPVWFELVIWKTVMESSAPHACLSCTQGKDLANPGTYTCSVSPKGGAGWSCHGAEALDWTAPFGSVQASAKLSNDSNARVTPPSDLPGSYAFKVHYTAVLVEAGKTFSGWASYPAPTAP